MIGSVLRASLSGSFTLLAMTIAAAVAYYFTRDRAVQQNEHHYRGYDAALRSYFGVDNIPPFPLTNEVRDAAKLAYSKVMAEMQPPEVVAGEGTGPVPADKAAPPA